MHVNTLIRIQAAITKYLRLNDLNSTLTSHSFRSRIPEVTGPGEDSFGPSRMLAVLQTAVSLLVFLGSP